MKNKVIVLLAWCCSFGGCNPVHEEAIESSAASCDPERNPPCPPQLFRARSDGPADVLLSWFDKSDTEVGFEINRASNGGVFTFLEQVGSDTESYQDDPSPGTYLYRIRALGETGASIWVQASVTVFDDAPAGITATITGDTNVVAESGLIDGFWTRLTSQPSGQVALRVTSSDPAAARTDVAYMYLDQGNWNVPQFVYQSAVQNTVVDGTRQVTISLSVDPLRTTANEYDVLPPVNLPLTVLDDDPAGITVLLTNNANAVAESGLIDGFWIRLNSQPSGDVMLRVASSDPAAARTDLDQLSFTPGDWNIQQFVYESAVQNTVVDGTRQVTISLSVDPLDTTASEYRIIQPLGVPLTVLDDDR